jgi:valyl-tRNA synthetase
LKYSRNEKFFKANSPCTLRPQGKEIIRTWLYYTLLKCYLLTGKTIFEDAWINYHIIDEHGYKMSKSKGNVIDPHAILEKFGAEPFRLWSVLEGNLEKTDFRCSFERIESNSKTLTKLWNVARYISQFKKPKTKKPKLLTEDKWILGELNAIIDYSIIEYDKYNFHSPAEKTRAFLWEAFASHYLEMVKGRAYNKDNKFKKAEQESAIWTLYYCLETLLLLWAPIVPFITQKLYSAINKGINIHELEFPKADKKLSAKMLFTTAELLELNSKIWQTKKEQGKALNAEIESFETSKKFKPIAAALKQMHNIKELKLK